MGHHPVTPIMKDACALEEAARKLHDAADMLEEAASLYVHYRGWDYLGRPALEHINAARETLEKLLNK